MALSYSQTSTGFCACVSVEVPQKLFYPFLSSPLVLFVHKSYLEFCPIDQIHLLAKVRMLLGRISIFSFSNSHSPFYEYETFPVGYLRWTMHDIFLQINSFPKTQKNRDISCTGSFIPNKFLYEAPHYSAGILGMNLCV